MRTSAILVLLLLTFPAIAAAQEEVPAALPSVTLPPELDRVLRDYEKAWEAGDSEGLAALFTPDGFVPTRSGWRRGTEEIVSAYEIASGPLRLRALAWSVSDSVGYIIGAYRYGEREGPDRGKFILALRSIDGRWSIAADLDNQNRN